MMAQLFSWDKGLFEAVNGFAGGWLLDETVRFTLGNYLLRCIPLLPLWYFWYQPGSRQNERRDAVICLIVGALVALVANRGLSGLLPFRIRPMYAEGITFYPLAGTSTRVYENWSSFPSDNATFFFALATGIYFMCRALGAYLFVHAVLLVCLPRVYAGIHYPSDIVVGAAIGIVTIIPVMTISRTRRLFFCQHIRQWADIYAGLFAALFFVVTFEMAVLFDDVRFVFIGVARLLHAKGMVVREEATIFIVGFICLAVTAACVAAYSRYFRRR
jgi:membrane-associated phospholipid phosphatase